MKPSSDFRIRAGRLRHRVTVRLPVEVKNETTGGYTTTYRTIANRLPANVDPKGGKRVVSGEQIDARTDYTVHVRYRTDLTARQQLIYHAADGDRTLDIVSVIDLQERRVLLRLECTEGE